MPCRLFFSWPHGGSDVRLAGSFNDWSPAPMSLGEDGAWSVELSGVAPGQHQFKFVVDGQWVHDGEQPNVQNEVGSFNNVATAVEEEEEADRHDDASHKSQVCTAQPNNAPPPARN